MTNTEADIMKKMYFFSYLKYVLLKIATFSEII